MHYDLCCGVFRSFLTCQNYKDQRPLLRAMSPEHLFNGDRWKRWRSKQLLKTIAASRNFKTIVQRRAPRAQYFKAVARRRSLRAMSVKHLLKRARFERRFVVPNPTIAAGALTSKKQDCECFSPKIDSRYTMITCFPQLDLRCAATCSQKVDLSFPMIFCARNQPGR